MHNIVVNFNLIFDIFFISLPTPYSSKFHENSSKIPQNHEKFMKKLGLRRYPHFGIEDRNRFYARTAVAGALRLLDEVLKQPGIDPARVGYCGSSHGGGLGLLLAAFSDKIKAAYCGVPNFGDRGGFLTGRHTPDSNSPEYRSHLETLLYFDTSYAARRIRQRLLRCKV